MNPRTYLEVEESDWDPLGPWQDVSPEPIWESVDERDIALRAIENVKYVMRDSPMRATSSFIELAKDLKRRFLIRSYDVASEISQIITISQPVEFCEYYEVRARNRLRYKYFTHAIRLLKSKYGHDYVDKHHDNIFEMICRGVGTETYNIRYDEKCWFHDHVWSSVFGFRHHHAYPKLEEFMSRVEELSPIFIAKGPRYPISARRELAIDLYRFVKVRGMKFCYEIAQVIWPKITRENRGRYMRVAMHRGKVELCKLIEDHLRPHYIELGDHDVPTWRPSYRVVSRECL